MGWTESPPDFCATTETVTNVANQRAMQNWHLPPHRLATQAASEPDLQLAGVLTDRTLLPATQLPPPQPAASRNSRPVGRFDDFIDDFIGLAQGSPQRLKRLRNILLHSLDEVLRPLEATDGPTVKNQGRSRSSYKTTDPGRRKRSFWAGSLTHLT